MKLSGQQQLAADYIAGAMITGNCYVPEPPMRRTVHALQRKGLVILADVKGGGARWELTSKGKLHVHSAYRNGPVVASSELSAVKMTAGNEKRYPQVILDDVVHRWVGIGWVEEGAPTIGQRNCLPRVVQGEW